ncbi:hypothetical protein K0M31_016381 [Melipona bicolor]|uniref:Uncharacterized protein n=1 Tax=Melipona bicolor TaxID=60889 RepID=A0AA40G881_9HYME|nr:hypothetical protein K0M31_016381 [Melipona bicolor]
MLCYSGKTSLKNVTDRRRVPDPNWQRSLAEMKFREVNSLQPASKPDILVTLAQVRLPKLG